MDKTAIMHLLEDMLTKLLPEGENKDQFLALMVEARTLHQRVVSEDRDGTPEEVAEMERIQSALDAKLVDIGLDDLNLDPDFIAAANARL